MRMRNYGWHEIESSEREAAFGGGANFGGASALVPPPMPLSTADVYVKAEKKKTMHVFPASTTVTA